MIGPEVVDVCASLIIFNEKRKVAIKVKDNLLRLDTEARNENSMHLPDMSISEATAMMNNEDECCVPAVRAVLPRIDEVIACCVKTIRKGGKVIFIGAAHSGYLGALDAYEANATFGTNDFMSIVAGHPTDIMKTDGSAEDDSTQGGIDLQEAHVTSADFVIALSSSGRTPYAIGALQWCQNNGVSSACITNNHGAQVSQYADIAIEADAGPEVITGSTRLKAGSCQKMILNMITTITMAQVGNVYENLMINVPPVSDKMRKRLAYIMTQATGCNLEHATELLKECSYDVKTALVMEKTGLDNETAHERIEEAKGDVNRVLKMHKNIDR